MQKNSWIGHSAGETTKIGTQYDTHVDVFYGPKQLLLYLIQY